MWVCVVVCLYVSAQWSVYSELATCPWCTPTVALCQLWLALAPQQPFTDRRVYIMDGWVNEWIIYIPCLLWLPSSSSFLFFLTDYILLAHYCHQPLISGITWNGWTSYRSGVPVSFFFFYLILNGLYGLHIWNTALSRHQKFVSLYLCYCAHTCAFLYIVGDANKPTTHLNFSIVPLVVKDSTIDWFLLQHIT